MEMFHKHKQMPIDKDGFPKLKVCLTGVVRIVRDKEHEEWERNFTIKTSVFIVMLVIGAPGCIGMLAKTHHCAIDGTSGLEMAMALADLTPEMSPVAPPKTPWTPDPVPTDVDLMLRTWGNNLLRPIEMAALAARSNAAGPPLSSVYQQQLPSAQTPIPKTRFNAPVTGHRTIGFERFSLDEVRAMKNEIEGATVNDLALSVCGGAIRQYLEAKLELPDESGGLRRREHPGTSLRDPRGERPPIPGWT